MTVERVITEHMDLWTGAVTQKSGSGRGSRSKRELTGIKKLRELILELAIRGKLVPQESNHGDAFNEIAGLNSASGEKGAGRRNSKLHQEISDDEQLFEVPTGWVWTRLGTLGVTLTGGTPKKSNPELFGTHIPFIKPGDIERGLINYENEGLSVEGLAALGKFAGPGSVLMVCIGTIGKSALIDRPCTFNQQINAIDPYDDGYSEYLSLCLSARYFQDAAWQDSSSTTIAILNKGKWEAIPVPIPPLAEQHRIVQKVDELMALCDQLEQQTGDQLEAHERLVDTLLDTLTRAANATELAENWARVQQYFDTLFTTEHSIERLKQTILQLAVMGRLVAQDSSAESAQMLLEKVALERSRLVKERRIKKPKSLGEVVPDETPFSLPSGWAWVKFGELAEFINGDRSKNYPNRSEYEDQGVAWINTGHIEPDGTLSTSDMNFISREKFDSLRSGKIEPHDLVYCLRGATFGKTAAVEPYREGAIASSLMIIRPHLYDLRDYIFKYLISPFGRSQIFRFDNGSAQPNLSANSVTLYAFPLPPIAEQRRIVCKVDQLMNLCEQLQAGLHQVGDTRRKLAESIVDEIGC